MSTANWLAITMAGRGTNVPPPKVGVGHFALGFLVGFITAIILLVVLLGVLISVGGTGS